MVLGLDTPRLLTADSRSTVSMPVAGRTVDSPGGSLLLLVDANCAPLNKDRTCYAFLPWVATAVQFGGILSRPWGLEAMVRILQACTRTLLPQQVSNRPWQTRLRTHGLHGLMEPNVVRKGCSNLVRMQANAVPGISSHVSFITSACCYCFDLCRLYRQWHPT